MGKDLSMMRLYTTYEIDAGDGDARNVCYLIRCDAMRDTQRQ